MWSDTSCQGLSVQGNKMAYLLEANMYALELKVP